MEGVTSDVRIAARLLWRHPILTATAILTLALGIGAVTAMSSVVEAVVLRQVAYAAPEQLVELRQTANQQGAENLAAADFRDLRAQCLSFSRLAAYTNTSVSLTGAGDPEQLTGSFVTAEWFRLLGRQPVLGRGFLPGEDSPGRDRVVVLGHALWERRFASDREVVGRKVSVNGEPRTIVGVMPADFEVLDGEELWLPLAFSPADLADRGRSFVHVLARRKLGVDLPRAQRDLDLVASRLARQYPATDLGRGFNAIPLQEWLAGDLRPALWRLFGAVGFLMLLVCTNLTHLELARAAARQREAAIRTAIGASRGRLLRERLTGAVLLALVGGGCGVLLAAWGTRRLIALNPGSISRLSQAGIDLRVLAFSLVVSVATGVAFGLLPALQASRTDPQAMLKEGAARATGGLSRQRLRSVLLVSQVALAVVLLFGAGLLVKSFRQLLQVDPGFEPERCLAMRVVLPQKTPPEAAAAFARQALARLREIPAVRTAGLVTNVPLTTSRLSVSLDIGARPVPPPGQGITVDYDAVSPGFFAALGVHLVRGRTFVEGDGNRAPRVAVISKTMADRFWPGADPLGQRVSFNGQGGPWCTVVGVVGDIRRFALGEPPAPQAYVPFAQDPWFFMTFVLRTHADPQTVVPDARRAIWAIAPDQAISWIRPMAEVVASSVARPQLSMVLLAIFAGIAILLTAVGMYGVTAHSVNQRVQEIGLRIALGADRGDLMWLVVGNMLRLTSIGLAIGCATALALGRTLSNLLFKVSATDPITLAAVAALLVILAITSTYIPAHRAASVAPGTALKRD
jgi:putative ABC transport system permease protein